MTWYQITISEACVLGGSYHRLCRAFQQAFISAGAPPSMALFAERVTLSDTRRIYLSPGSMPYVEGLLEDFESRACDRPLAGDVTMVYGVPGAKAQLLPAVEPVKLRDEADDVVRLLPMKQPMHAQAAAGSTA